MTLRLIEILTFICDKDGNRTSIAWADLLSVPYTYDGADRLVTVGNSAVGVAWAV